MVISIMMSIFGLRIKEDRMKKAMDVILKKATLCLLLGGILAILLLSACTSAESGNSDSIIEKSPSMGADEEIFL